MYEKIKKFYKLGIYKSSHVKAFADKGIISKEQYNSIVGIV